jgi:hypothetical protein
MEKLELHLHASIRLYSLDIPETRIIAAFYEVVSTLSCSMITLGLVNTFLFLAEQHGHNDQDHVSGNSADIVHAADFA